MVALQQRRPHRPRRRLGRDGGRSRARLGAFRQCLGQRAGGAVRRHRAPALDRAVLRRRAAARSSRRWCSTSPPRSSPRARCWWRARAARSCPTNALIGLDGKMSADPRVLYGDYTATGPRQAGKGRGRHPRLRRAQGLGARPHLRAARRLAHRHEGDGPRAAAGAAIASAATACCRSTSTPRWSTPRRLFSDDVARYVAYFKSAKPATPGGEVLIPGEPEKPHARAAPRRRHPAARRHLGRHRRHRARGRRRRAPHPAGGGCVRISLSPCFFSMGRGLG